MSEFSPSDKEAIKYLKEMLDDDSVSPIMDSIEKKFEKMMDEFKSCVTDSRFFENKINSNPFDSNFINFVKDYIDNKFKDLTNQSTIKFEDLEDWQLELIKGEPLKFSDLSYSEKEQLRGSVLTFDELTEVQKNQLKGEIGPIGPIGKKGPKGDAAQIVFRGEHSKPPNNPKPGDIYRDVKTVPASVFMYNETSRKWELLTKDGEYVNGISGGGGLGKFNVIDLIDEYSPKISASNIGTLPTSVGLFDSKVGDDLQFKNLVGAGVLNVVDIGDTLVISADTSAVGEANQGTNLGGQIRVYKDKVGLNLRYRTLSAGSNIIINEDSDIIGIETNNNVDFTLVSANNIESTSANFVTLSATNYNGLPFESLISYPKDLFNISTSSSDGNYIISSPSIINSLSTALISGGQIVKATDTSINISAFHAHYVNNITDMNNPSFDEKDYGPFLDVPITNILTETFTIFSVDIDGNIEQTYNLSQTDLLRTNIIIGIITHPNGIVSQISQQTQGSLNPLSTVSDLALSIGVINVYGNNYFNNYNDLSLSKTVGRVFKLGINYKNDPGEPNSKNLSQEDILTFIYGYRDGTGGCTAVPNISAVDVDHYDDGSGTLVLVPNKKWTVQNMYLFPDTNISYMLYGQKLYDSLADAIEGTTLYDTDIPDVTRLAILRAQIITKQGSINLSNSIENIIINTDKFGQTGSSSTGVIDLIQGRINTVTVSADYESESYDFVLCETINPLTVFLPDALINKNTEINIKKISDDSNTLTISADSGQLIDGESFKLIQIKNTSIRLVSNGSNWYII